MVKRRVSVLKCPTSSPKPKAIHYLLMNSQLTVSALLNQLHDSSHHNKYILNHSHKNITHITQLTSCRRGALRADRAEPRTDSWIAGVVNAPQAPAVGVQAAPLVPSLLQLGAAAARRAEAVAAVPGQHRPSLSHDSCTTQRRGTKIIQLIFRKM